MRRMMIIASMLAGMASWGQNRIQAYEYWFNGDYNAKTQQPVTPATQVTLNTLISASALSDGLHLLNLRFRDDSARYSSTLSQFFYKYTTSDGGAAGINAYQYWFDGDFQAAVWQPVSPAGSYSLSAAFSAELLGNGLHLFNIRFRDNKGQWSSVITQFFYKASPLPSPGENLVSAWQYWFDSDFAGAVVAQVSPVQQYQLSAAINTASLSGGLHLLNLRFKDIQNQWSSTISQFVYITPGGAGLQHNTMARMQYWFDDQFSSAQMKPLALQPVVQVTDLVDATALPDGLHTLQVRFADSVGQWSSALSQFFYKAKETGVTTNVVTGYRYWFNSDDGSKMVIHTTPPQNPLLLTEPIDMGCLTAGLNRLHMQFVDQKGLWSSPLTDTIGVTPPQGNIYRFTGNGQWSNAANWQNNSKPALDLPGCKEIIIDHAAGGQCILDVPQYLLKNARLTVLPGKVFIIPQNLMQH